MNKPESIRKAEMVNGIYAAINAAELPPDTVADKLMQILADVQQIAAQKLQQDLMEYNQALAEEQSEEEQEETEEQTEGEE